jgi:hypothetical protein
MDYCEKIGFLSYRAFGWREKHPEAEARFIVMAKPGPFVHTVSIPIDLALADGCLVCNAAGLDFLRTLDPSGVMRPSVEMLMDLFDQLAAQSVASQYNLAFRDD